MARDKSILILRTTRANLNTQKTANGLLAGELYFITDENRIAIGTAVNNYADINPYDATQAAIMPNTAPAAGQIPIGNAGGTAYAPNSISGDGSLTSAGVLSINKTRLNVRNETGSQIVSTRAVYVSGFNNYPLIALADNTAEIQHNVIGITIAPINNQANGYIATSGQLDAETNAWTVGTELYLSTAGVLTSVAPTSGSVRHVAIVTVQGNYPNGKLLIYQFPEENYFAGGSGVDLIMRTGDALGVNKFSFRNYTNTEKASIDSNGNINSVALTASTLLGTDANKNIVSLSTATYPSLTELSYVKGVTSAIQTQIGTKISSSSTDTLTNKRITKRVSSTTSAASITPEIDTYDIYHLTALAVDLTINNHSTSTPTDGEQLKIRLLDNGSAHNISFGTNYVAKAGVALPTTTTAGKNMELLFEWNANLTKWNLMAKGLEA